MIRIVAVPPWNARGVAKQNKELIERSCSRSSNATPKELLAECERREAVLWLIVRSDIIGACFTRSVKLSDGRKAIEITALAGRDTLSWTQLLRERLHRYRKAEGAEMLLVIGRKGWSRVFKIAPVGMNMNGRWIIEDYDE
jgi:hypothetical protein